MNIDNNAIIWDCMACAAGKEWLGSQDMGGMGPDLAAAYLCMLAVDSLLGFVTAVEALTDARTAEKGHVSENAPPDPLTCIALVNSTWKIVLPVLSYLLDNVTSEGLDGAATEGMIVAALIEGTYAECFSATMIKISSDARHCEQVPCCISQYK